MVEAAPRRWRDRNLMARANTDLADAFGTGDVHLIDGRARVVGSSYTVSTLSRGLWNAVTGTGYGIARPVDPQPHFQDVEVTVDPAYPLDDVNQTLTVTAELAWGILLAGAARAPAVVQGANARSGIAAEAAVPD
jgi:hypothetical protein